MFIDYLTLMLVNLVAGLVLLAYFLIRGDNVDNWRRWVPGFVIVGIVGLATGLHMIFTWPLPGPFNFAFGEMTVLYSVLFLGAAVAFAYRISLMSVSVYAPFAGIAAIIIGISIISRGLTNSPTISGVGFILTGAGAVLLPVALALWRNNVIRYGLAVIFIIAAIIWAITGYGAYPNHFELFKDWVPATLQSAQTQR